MKKEEKLYLNLESIEPRVSRTERLALRRKGDCPDCGNQILNKAKRGVKHLYWFYLVILVLGLATLVYYNKFQKNDHYTMHTPINVTNISFNRKIISSFIEQKNRYGISMIIRNHSSKKWNLKKIIISSKKLKNKLEFQISEPIKAKNYQVYFITLPKDILDFDDFEILTK